MKNNILFSSLFILLMIISSCVDRNQNYVDNCLDTQDGFGNSCGLLPVPSENNEAIDFCTEVQDLVDQAEPDDKDNILIDNRGQQPVIAAPHGASDLGTEDIVDKVGDSLSFSSIRYFRFRTALNANVNRPTLQANTAAQEQWDYDAASVYHCYHEKVQILFEANVNNFYTEVHGNNRDESIHRLEIVCSQSITDDQDEDIRDIFEDEITNTYGVKDPLHAYTLRTEPDSIYFTASATRSCGIFCAMDDDNIPAIHIEIPAYYRGDGSDSEQRALIVDMLKNALQRIDDEVL